MDPDRDILDLHQLAGRLVHGDDGDLRHDAVRQPEIQTVCLGQAASAAAVLLAAASRTSGSRCRTRGSSSTSRTPRAAARVPTSRSRPTRSSGCAPDGGDHRAAHRARPRPGPSDIERDKILTAEDALDYGIVDEVIASRKVRAGV
jgi:ATP-dependent Clp protease protease subunit